MMAGAVVYDNTVFGPLAAACSDPIEPLPPAQGSPPGDSPRRGQDHAEQRRAHAVAEWIPVVGRFHLRPDPTKCGEPVYAEYVEHVPPDPGAAKLWLTNRRPEEWREKSVTELTGKDGAALVPVLNVTISRAP
jgi:hypothetical protein